MRIASSLALTVLLAFGSQTFAEGLIYKLPADGVSAVFDLKFDSRGMEGTGSITVASVGKATVDGKACRWIEFIFEMNVGERERKVVAKVLMPEAEIKAGQKPFDNRIRGWIRTRVGREVRDLLQNDFGPIPAFIANPLDESKKLEAIELDIKPFGKIKCKGESGSVTYNDRAKNVVSVETRLHEKSPFGVVWCRFNIKSERNGELVPSANMTLTLKSVGKENKTQLPDNN